MLVGCIRFHSVSHSFIRFRSVSHARLPPSLPRAALLRGVGRLARAKLLRVGATRPPRLLPLLPRLSPPRLLPQPARLVRPRRVCRLVGGGAARASRGASSDERERFPASASHASSDLTSPRSIHSNDRIDFVRACALRAGSENPAALPCVRNGACSDRLGGPRGSQHARQPGPLRHVRSVLGDSRHRGAMVPLGPPSDEIVGARDE